MSQLPSFPHIYIVDASAGSGKTYALARRYLQLALKGRPSAAGIQLNNILAITFTNKASHEMKERIFYFLKKTALGDFSSEKEKESFLVSLGLDKDKAGMICRQLLDEIVINYNHFQIQTIDSFINAILSGCAFKLELSSSFKVRRDYEDNLSYILERLIDKALRDKEVAEKFLRFLRQYLYIENRSGWFPKKDIFVILKRLFYERNKHSYGFVSSGIDQSGLFSGKSRLLDKLEELNTCLPEETNAVFRRSLSNVLKNMALGFDVSSLSDFFGRDEFPVRKGSHVCAKVSKLWSEITGMVRKLCETEAVSVYDPYIEIFNLFIKDLEEFARKEDVMFLESMNSHAGRLFSSGAIAPPELYYRLATRLRHFLIDEFQDTGVLQWENLYPMIEEALSTGGSLFYVGDKKQAIYRFRGGEASLIDSVRKSFSGYKSIETRLSMNYRSQKEIVEFNNLIFSRDNIMRFLDSREASGSKLTRFSDADKQDIAGVFADSGQSFREENGSGFVRVEALGGRDKAGQLEEAKQRFLSLLEELKGRFSYSDIAVLVRENNEVVRVSEWLLENSIPVESERTLSIRQNAHIKSIVSLLKFLNSPIDDIAFACFITSDVFAAASGLRAELIRDFIFSLRKDGERGSDYLYIRFREKFPEAWKDCLEALFKGIGFIPLYELLIKIYEKFAVLENFEDYQGFFMHLLELVKERQEEDSSISGFLEYFDALPEERLYVNVSRQDSVKVLTIHKAKGLEFSVVVLPFLRISAKADKELVYSQKEELKILRIKQRYGSFSEKLGELYDKEYKKSFIDELNSIYVAFTRAVDELYIFVGSSYARSVNQAALLLPSLNFESGVSGKKAKKGPVKEVSVRSIRAAKYSEWLNFLSEEFEDVRLLKEQDRLQRGELLHKALSYIGNLYGQDKESVLKSAISRMRAGCGDSFDCGELESSLRALLEQESLSRVFCVKGAAVYTEFEVVDQGGDTKRIDRLVVSEREVTVVDYKSSCDDEQAHRRQLKAYMQAIGQIYTSLKVSGCIVYIDKKEAQEVR